jgi:hypothetical protein
MHHFLLRQQQSTQKRGKIHTRDIDSLSWYTNSDHDVIMTLSALRTKLKFRLVSLHVRFIKTDAATSTSFRDLHNSQRSCRRARFRSTSGTPHQPIELYPLPACRVYLRDGTGHITSYEKRTLTNEFPEYEIRAYLQQRNGWTAHIFDSIN